MANTLKLFTYHKCDISSLLAEVLFKHSGYKRFNCSVSVFKGFLSGACKIYSKRYIDGEIQFLIDVFTENGYERKILEKISKNYLNKLQNPPVINKDKDLS